MVYRYTALETLIKTINKDLYSREPKVILKHEIRVFAITGHFFPKGALLSYLCKTDF